MRIAVFGANGPTGREVLRIGAQSGREMVAASRHPDELDARAGVTARLCNVLDPIQTEEMIDGADAVLSTLGVPFSKDEITVYSRGITNIIAAMHGHGVSRLVCVSSSAVDPAAGTHGGWFFEKFMAPYVRKLGRTLYDDMTRMEEAVEASDLDWTVLRPSGLFDHDRVTDYRIAEHYVPGAFTARSDLAAAMLAQLDSSEYSQRVAAVCTEAVHPSLPRLIWREAVRKPGEQKRTEERRAARAAASTVQGC